jgi:predicted Zn-dependent protease
MLLDELRHRPDNVHARSLLAGNLMTLGERDAAIAQAERSLAMAPGDGRIRYNAACTYARGDMTDRAMEELRNAIRDVPSYVSDWPKRDPDLASLRDLPEFIELFGKA